MYVDTDATRAGSLANRLAVNPDKQWLKDSVAEVQKALEDIEKDPNAYHKTIQSLYKSRMKRKTIYHLDLTNEHSVAAKRNAACKAAGLSTEYPKFFPSGNYDLEQHLLADKLDASLRAVNLLKDTPHHRIDDVIKSYGKFEIELKDPEVVYNEFAEYKRQSERYEVISSALEAKDNPLTLLDSNKSVFRADSFSCGTKELQDIWLYECLPYLNKELYNVKDTENLTNEELAKNVSRFISSLYKLKPSSIVDTSYYAFIDAFRISDDFEDPFKVPTSSP